MHGWAAIIAPWQTGSASSIASRIAGKLCICSSQKKGKATSAIPITPA